MKQWVMEFNFFGVRGVFFPSCVFISNRELCYSDIYAVVSEDLYEVHWGVPLACVVSKKQWSEGLTLCLRLSDVRLFCLIVCFYIFTSCEDFWFSILKKLHIFTVVHQLNSLLRYSISVPKSFNSGELWTQQILVLINFISQLNWKRYIWKWLLAL